MNVIMPLNIMNNTFYGILSTLHIAILIMENSHLPYMEVISCSLLH